MSNLGRKLTLSVTAGHEPISVVEKMDFPSHEECNKRVDAILNEK